MGIPADSAGSADASNSSQQPVATVLVADDNHDMVESTAMLLRTANYNVVCTCSVQEALDVLDERADVDLVLSDIRMPEYTGFDLLRVLRYRWPKMPVVLITGFNVVESDMVPRGAVVVRKPFTLLELDDVIRRQLLAARSGGTSPPTIRS